MRATQLKIQASSACWDPALVENDMLDRVDARGDEGRGDGAGAVDQFLGVGLTVSRVQIDDAEDAVMLVLQRDELLDRAEIVAQRQVAGRLDAGKDEGFEAAHDVLPKLVEGLVAEPRCSGRGFGCGRLMAGCPPKVQVGFCGVRTAGRIQHGPVEGAGGKRQPEIDDHAKTVIRTESRPTGSGCLEAGSAVSCLGPPQQPPISAAPATIRTSATQRFGAGGTGRAAKACWPRIAFAQPARLVAIAMPITPSRGNMNRLPAGIDDQRYQTKTTSACACPRVRKKAGLKILISTKAGQADGESGKRLRVSPGSFRGEGAAFKDHRDEGLGQQRERRRRRERVRPGRIRGCGSADERFFCSPAPSARDSSGSSTTPMAMPITPSGNW
jgi:hypothetical protein